MATYRLPHTRLGGAVQLCAPRFLGTFLPTQVPAVAVRTLPERVAPGELQPLRDLTNWQHQLVEFP